MYDRLFGPKSNTVLLRAALPLLLGALASLGGFGWMRRRELCGLLDESKSLLPMFATGPLLANPEDRHVLSWLFLRLAGIAAAFPDYPAFKTSER